jgi:ABC-type multidrug transport system fused ATPase/permease subunit
LLDVVEQCSIERIISIAKDLVLDDILGNPEALNSYTGERGVNLSGGQIQRIGILRALYREPKILILDESSSALDADNEKSVLDTIRKYLPDCTIISVAHRLSSIKDCDTIFYFTDGKIVADGNFEELVAKSPEFKRNVELLGMKTQLNRNN